MLWLDTQLLAMGVMFLTGAGVAIGLDLLGILSGRLRVDELGLARSGRRKKPIRRRSRSGLWDVMVWMVVTPVVFAAILISNRGEPRLYVFVGLALGLGAYFVLARRFVVWAGSTARAAVARAGGAAAREIAAPVRSAGVGMGKMARRLGGWTAGGGRVLGDWARGRQSALGRLGRRILAGIKRPPKE